MTNEHTGNPYVGPQTFTEAQSHLFFGREREANDLFARVLSERLVLFYAQSGAGKSSLINARLIPRLRESGYAVLPVARVSGELPSGVTEVDNIYLFNLMLSLDSSGRDPGRFAHMQLAQFLARLSSDDGRRYVYEEAVQPAQHSETASPSAMPYVLIIDQFEELITSNAGRWREREEFFRQLNQVMVDDPKLWTVLSFRADYLAPMEPYAPLMMDRMRARFYMERMGIDAALEAVSLPAKVGGRPFAPGVAETLRNDLCQVRVPGQKDTVTGQYVEPVQLQVVCYQLWENIQGRPPGPISADQVREAGDVNRALNKFYDDTLRAVLAEEGVQRAGVSERQLRMWFDKELITDEGTRDLVRQGEDSTGSMPNAVVSRLQKRFLVRSEARSGDTWIELVHDRFVDPIRKSNQDWFARNLNPLTQAAQAWHEAGRNPAKLYAGSQLTAAAAQLQSHPEEFGELEQEFVEQGQKVETRHTVRQQRSIAVLMAALALVFMALAYWAIRSRAQTAASLVAVLNANATAKAANFESIAGQATAEAASTEAVAGRAIAQAASTEAVAGRATAEAASTEAVAGRATAQAANTAQVKAIDDLAASLRANLTALAAAIGSPSPTATATRRTTPTRTGTPQGTITGTRAPTGTPTVTGTMAPTKTSAPSATPNPIVIAQQTQLAQVQQTQTALAPPAGRIVFVSTRDATSGDLYIMRADGQGVERLTNISAWEVSYTEANRGLLAFSAKSEKRQSIYTVPVVGGRPGNLTGFESDNWSPAFSKNGRWIAFVSSRDNFDWEIYTMNFDGTGVRRLTNDDPERNTMPAWSPDGTRIVFVTIEGCGKESCPSAIRVMSSDGTNIKRLVYFEGKTVAHPDWSPDGKRIAFGSDRDGSMDIFVVNADGSNLHNVTKSPYDENHPAWSLDGQWIAFTRYTHNTDIFVMTADGNRVIQVTNNPASDWYPVWVR